jgi:uncharacterized protein (AIM24 family)
MKGNIFSNIENTSNEHQTFVLQNTYSLLVNLNGMVYATQGSMVAYKGNIDFDRKGAGVSRMMKSMATGEGLTLMTIKGQGDVYLARSAQLVHIIELENDAITVSSRNILAFTEGIDWDINVIRSGVMGMMAGGLFNTTLKGAGLIAITSIGTPIVIPVQGGGVFADVNSIIAWSTGLNVSIKSSFKAKSMIGLGSGESFQMAFEGNGYIVVQPGEGIAMVA